MYCFVMNRVIGFTVPAFASILSIPLTLFHAGHFLTAWE